MFGIPSGGKSIHGGVVDNIKLWHGNPGNPGQILGDCIKLKMIFLVGWRGAGYPQNYFIGVVVTDETKKTRKDQCYTDSAKIITERISDEIGGGGDENDKRCDNHHTPEFILVYLFVNIFHLKRILSEVDLGFSRFGFRNFEMASFCRSS